MRRVRRAWGLAGSVCALALALNNAPAVAGTFTVQLCGQQDRASDGLPFGDVDPGPGGSKTQDCDAGGTGLLLTAGSSGMPAGATGSVSLRPADGGRITRATLWHESTIADDRFDVQLLSYGDGGPSPIDSATGTGGGIGGADQAVIGPVSSTYDFAGAPVSHIDYLLHCLASDGCFGGTPASLRLYAARLTIDDGSAPVIDVISSPSTATGKVTTFVRAHDTVGGIKAVRLFGGYGGPELGEVTVPCDYRSVRPCPTSTDVGISWESSALDDGSVRLVVQAIDAGGNQASDALNSSVDDRPPILTNPPRIQEARPFVGLPTHLDPGSTKDPVGRWTVTWFRCADATLAACVPRPSGGISDPYVPSEADQGGRLRARVTYVDAAGQIDAFTDPTDPVPLAAPYVLRPPSILGGDLSPQIGTRLTVDPGRWTVDNPRFSYQWLRCLAICVPVPQASTGSYIVTASDFGSELSVLITACNVEGRCTDSPPLRTGTVVKEEQLRPLVAPTVAGDVAVGGELEATPGTWTSANPHISWAWKRCTTDGSSCRPIGGARGATYRVASADHGRQLAAEVTATYGGQHFSLLTGRVGPVPTRQATLLPRPFVLLGDDVTGRAGRALHTLGGLRIRRLIPGSTVVFTCRHRCRHPTTLTRHVRGTTIKLRLPDLELTNGAQVDIAVSHPGRIGRVWRFRVRGETFEPHLLCIDSRGEVTGCDAA